MVISFKISCSKSGSYYNKFWRFHQYGFHLINLNFIPSNKIEKLYYNKQLTIPFARICDHYSYHRDKNKLINYIIRMNYCETCGELKICDNLTLYNKIADCRTINKTNWNEFFLI